MFPRGGFLVPQKAAHVKTPETMGEMLQFDENTDTCLLEVERTTFFADHFLLEDGA